MCNIGCHPPQLLCLPGQHYTVTECGVYATPDGSGLRFKLKGTGELARRPLPSPAEGPSALKEIVYPQEPTVYRHRQQNTHARPSNKAGLPQLPSTAHAHPQKPKHTRATAIRNTIVQCAIVISGAIKSRGGVIVNDRPQAKLRVFGELR